MGEDLARPGNWWRSRLLRVFLAFVFVTLVSWVIAAIVGVLRPANPAFFSPLPFVDWRVLSFFVIHQSLFFLGAAWFRKTHLVKTVLVMTAFSIGLVIFVGLMLRLFFPELATIPGMNIDVDFDGLIQNYQALLEGSWVFLRLLYYFGLPLSCWTIAWLRVRETQVSHGI